MHTGFVFGSRSAVGTRGVHVCRNSFSEHASAWRSAFMFATILNLSTRVKRAGRVCRYLNVKLTAAGTGRRKASRRPVSNLFINVQ